MNTHPHAHSAPTTRPPLHYVTVNGELIYSDTNGIKALKLFFARAKDPTTIDINYHIHKSEPVTGELKL